MKEASPLLVEFLASEASGVLKAADLYTITLTNGIVLRYTSSDFDIYRDGTKYSCKNAGIARSEMSWQTGLSVDDVTVEMNPSEKDSVGEIPLVEAFRNGTFDGAEIRLDMAFYKDGWENEPLFLDKLFVGTVDVEEVSGSYAKLNIKSRTELLNQSFPSDTYQAACHYSLYGEGCCVKKEYFSEKTKVAEGSTKKKIFCQIRAANGYYQNGVLQFTSGKNINIKKSIKIHESGVITLSTPLQYNPTIGDTFTISAGCDHTMTTCSKKFNNLSNFSGTPFIPKADSSVY